MSVQLKLITGCMITLLHSGLNAQSPFEKVDRDQIRKEISDTNASTGYTKLLLRFNAFDTTLTVTDYRRLYYGFVFQPGYYGYTDHQNTRIRKAIDARQFDEAIRIADSVLAIIPVSLSANYNRGLAMFARDTNDLENEHYLHRYYALHKAIISSGDGLTCNTAFRTIYVTDEYDIIYNYFKIEQHYSQSLVYPCDLIEVKPSDYFQNKDIYFDTSEPLLSLQKEHSEKLKKHK